MQVDPQIHSLILNTGINKRFRYGAFAKDPEDVAEAEAWENAKHQCRHASTEGRLCGGCCCSACQCQTMPAGHVLAVPQSPHAALEQLYGSHGHRVCSHNHTAAQHTSGLTAQDCQLRVASACSHRQAAY